jgi:hypothetical protein
MSLRFPSVVIAALTVSLVHAQSFEALRGIQPGRTVRITDTAGKRQTGVWKADANDAASFTTKEGEIALPHARIRRVELKTPGRRARNAAIGAGIGVAVAVTVDSTLGTLLRNESSTDGGRAITYLASIGIGTALGALTGGWHTVWRADSH